jgi:hypothetical protein
MRMSPRQIPLTASILFCAAGILLGLVDRNQVAQHWAIAALFIVVGVLVALMILYLCTIKPIQSDLACATQQRIDADQRRQAAERRAVEAALTNEIERERLCRVDVELKRKTACADQMCAELHEKLLILDQRLRSSAPKQKPHRGGERGGPPRF